MNQSTSLKEVSESLPQSEERVSGAIGRQGVDAQHTQLWPTPILSMEYKPDINAGLAEIIKRKEAEITKGVAIEVAGVKKGLTAHWQEFNVLSWDFDECRELRRRVLRGYKDFCESIDQDPADPEYKICGISCWANILRHGEGLLIHHHDPAFLSAHFQVQHVLEEGVPENSGDTVYYRPGFIERSHGDRQAGSQSLWDEQWKMHKPPKAGRLVIFPSFLRHEVRPYMGKTERISVALDIYIAKQRPLINFSTSRWIVPTREEVVAA